MSCTISRMRGSSSTRRIRLRAISQSTPRLGPMRRSFRLDPLHAMVARHRDDLFGRADLEERPRAGNPRILREDALVHVDSKTRSLRDREDSLADLERLREDLVGQREWIHPRAAGVRV